MSAETKFPGHVQNGRKMEVVQWDSPLVRDIHGTGIDDELAEEALVLMKEDPVKVGSGHS